MQSNITINKLKFKVNNWEYNVSLTFGLEKTGLVGKNGTGKTTLLKLITQPAQKSIISLNTEIAYLPQNYEFDSIQTVAEVISIEKLSLNGQDWDLQNRAKTLLAEFGLQYINLNKTICSLSGGERIKVALVGVILFPNKFWIMDEPTNNMDLNSRQVLYKYIVGHKNGALIVSHDRTLLNLMGRIIEMDNGELKTYGGNFASYDQEKINEKVRSEQLFFTARQKYNKTKKQMQTVKERQDKRIKRGQKYALEQNLPKMMRHNLKRSGEETAAKLKIMHDERVVDASTALTETRNNLKLSNQIQVDLSQTMVPKGKVIVELKNVSFAYNSNDKILDKFSTAIFGQDRVVIRGKNGSGKTTLIKLMIKKLKANFGEVYLGTEKIAYLEQTINILEPQQTLLENIIRISGLESNEARNWLARFLFTQDTVFKLAYCLSGGEKIRAGLAAILAGPEPAKLIVLDEPTNNLDLDSIEKVESALLGYQGTLIIISHDQHFLDQLAINKFIDLDNLNQT